MIRLMTSPRQLDIDITSRCNIKCSYCYHFSGPGDVSEDLPKEEWLQFFEELKECSVMKVAIFGGEPFCRNDFKDILESIVRNKMRYDIASNGTLITKEIANFLALTNRCNQVQISIDGSSPIIHESCRGVGTFYKALNGITYLRQEGIVTTVRVTIHRHNMHDLENITKLLLKDIGLSSISFNFANYSGLCKQNSDKILLTPKEKYTVMEIIQKLNKKYKGRIDSTIGPLALSKDWQKIENARVGLCKVPGGGKLAFCDSLMKQMAIRADGTMVPCTALSHISLGKINRDKLLDVWQNNFEFNKLRERRNIALSSFKFCQDCIYINYCSGGCPASAYEYVGEENHPSPDTCLKRFLEAGGKLPGSVAKNGSIAKISE